MTPEQIKELIDRLLNSGEILATKGFELATRQIISYGYLDLAWAIFWLIVFLVFLVATIVMIRKGKKEERSDKNRTNEDSYYFAGSFLLVGTVLAFSGILSEATLAYLHLSNPAWYAVQILVKTFIK